MAGMCFYIHHQQNYSVGLSSNSIRLVFFAQTHNGNVFAGAVSPFNYGASEASVVFRRLTEISEYERPAVVTRLRGSYLSNHLIDLHVVIFVA